MKMPNSARGNAQALFLSISLPSSEPTGQQSTMTFFFSQELSYGRVSKQFMIQQPSTGQETSRGKK